MLYTRFLIQDIRLELLSLRGRKLSSLMLWFSICKADLTSRKAYNQKKNYHTQLMMLVPKGFHIASIHTHYDVCQPQKLLFLRASTMANSTASMAGFIECRVLILLTHYGLCPHASSTAHAWYQDLKITYPHEIHNLASKPPKILSIHHNHVVSA